MSGTHCPPAPAVLQLATGHTHGDPRNALSFGRRVLGRPGEQMATALNAAARGRASICSLCRLLCPEQGSSHLSPLPSAPARQTFVLPQNISLIKMTIRSARHEASPRPSADGPRSSQIHTAAPRAEQPEQRPQKKLSNLHTSLCQVPSAPKHQPHQKRSFSGSSLYPELLSTNPGFPGQDHFGSLTSRTQKPGVSA